MTDTNVHSPAAVPAPECPTGHWGLCTLLGLVLIAGGAFVLWNVVAASIITAIFFAAALVVAGVVQIVHAFAARGWRSVTLSLVIGVLLGVGGLLLLANPLATSLGLTLGIAAMLLASGLLRLWLAWRHWSDYGFLLLLSGILGVAFGVVLLVGFPWSGLVVPGVILGVDLVFQGLWWLAVGLIVRRPPARAFAAT